MNPSERNTLIAIAGAILLVIAFAVWWKFYTQYRAEREAVAAQQEVQQSRLSSITDTEGNPYTIPLDDGKRKIVTHWASWCASCRADFAVIQAEVENSENTTAYALNRKEPLNTVQAYMRAYGLQSSDSFVFVVDTEDQHYEGIDGRTMPETIIYSERGEVLYHFKGKVDVTILNQYLGTSE